MPQLRHIGEAAQRQGRRLRVRQALPPRRDRAHANARVGARRDARLGGALRPPAILNRLVSNPRTRGGEALQPLRDGDWPASGPRRLLVSCGDQAVGRAATATTLATPTRPRRQQSQRGTWFCSLALPESPARVPRRCSAVSSRRHIDPCVRLSPTPLPDMLHRRHSAAWRINLISSPGRCYDAQSLCLGVRARGYH